MRIELESPAQPDVVRLIDALDAWQKPLYPAVSHHGIDVEALAQPNVLFAVVRTSDGVAIGCGAMVLGDGYGEIKRMYVVPAARGQGAGTALLDFLEAHARLQGCSRFALETGYRQPEALALYARSGYVSCGPFGSYLEDPQSVFMRKDSGDPPTDERC